MSVLEQTRFTRCPHCGSKRIAAQKNVMKCGACGYKLYFNCAAATSCLIVRDHHLLMIERKKDPGKGLLDLPGGFVDYDEGLEAGMMRELIEEISCEPSDLEYLTSAPNTYLYRDVLYHTVDCFFTACLPDHIEPSAGDDAANILWVPLDAIDFDNIAFDSVKTALRLYLSS